MSCATPVLRVVTCAVTACCVASSLFDAFQPKAKPPTAIIVLGLIAVGGLAFGWNASNKLDATQQAVTAQVTTLKTGVAQDMSSLKDRLVQDEKTNADLQGDLTVVTNKLKITQGQLKKARAEAAKDVEDTTTKLSALETSVHTEPATNAATDDSKNLDN